MKIAIRQSPLTKPREFTPSSQQPAGLIVLDCETGRITSTNRPALELLGSSPLEILGLKIWDIPHFREFTRSESIFRERLKSDVSAPVRFSFTCGHGFHREIRAIGDNCVRDGRSLVFYTLREAAASDLRKCA